jgi:hypothetical protein
MPKLSYSHNNSGGVQWLKPEDWNRLEQEGWTLEISRYRGHATGASKDFLLMAEGIAAWERLTGQCATDEGCNCCGRPHYFTFHTEGTPDKVEYFDLLEESHYSPSHLRMSKTIEEQMLRRHFNEGLIRGLLTGICIGLVLYRIFAPLWAR